ncbi:MAG: hypothetical protein IKW35_05150 [Paludibacteraceae bacterium]|nr:hypothetical protein [Paludibacteraceae bacterium]
MYNEQIEALISAALADGMLTEKEKQVLFKKAQSQGIDLDEFEMVLDARLVELEKAEKAKAAASAPKSNKVGDVKKCPNCGAIVQSYQGVCAECGYAFENIEVNYASKELSNLLMKAKSEKDMATIIDTFPIPMEKASLIAFATWLAPQSLDVQNPLSKSYQKKYDEVINKAKVTFVNDKDILPLITQHEKNKKLLVKNQLVAFIKTKSKIFLIIVGGILAIGLIVFAACFDDIRENRNSNKMVAAVNKGDLEMAKNIYLNYTGEKYFLADELSLVFWAYVEKEDMINAEKVLKIGEWTLDGYPIWDADKRGNEMAKVIYDYHIKNGEYDKARLMIENADSDYKLWGTHIMDVVTNMCEKGEKEKAKKYLNKYSGNIDDHYDNLGLDSYPLSGGGSTILGDRKYVIKLIKAEIANY